MATLRTSNQAREHKMARLYEFITSDRCAQLLDQIDSLAEALLEVDVSEKKTHDATWSRRGELIRSIQQTRGELSSEARRSLHGLQFGAVVRHPPSVQFAAAVRGARGCQHRYVYGRYGAASDQDGAPGGQQPWILAKASGGLTSFSFWIRTVTCSKPTSMTSLPPRRLGSRRRARLYRVPSRHGADDPEKSE
jgi:hypothetical protein